MTIDLQTLKATAQATAEKCPELLVTVPAGVMVELIRDVERWGFFKSLSCRLQAFPHAWGQMTPEKMDFMCDQAMQDSREAGE